MLPFASPDDVEAAVSPAVRQLRAGGLLAYPTETVYGFGGSLEASVVDALLRLKERDAAKGFVLLAVGHGMLRELDLQWSAAAESLAAAFWPGPLTLVLRSGRRGLHPALLGPSGGLAVRWTSLPSAARLIEAFGAPITSTSANAPGAPPASTGAAIDVAWNDAVRAGILLVLDAGKLPPSPPSTVVDCVMGGPPRLIRPGAIPAARLETVVGPLAPGNAVP